MLTHDARSLAVMLLLRLCRFPATAAEDEELYCKFDDSAAGVQRVMHFTGALVVPE